MPANQRKIVIDRPAGEVFAFFADPANDPRWRPHVKEIAATGPPGVGSSVHQLVAGPGGRGIPADFEVTAYEPPARYAFRVTAGPVRPVGEFRFAPAGGGTEVTFSLVRRAKWHQEAVLSRPVQESMDGEMAALDKAKTLIEHV